MSFDPYHCFLKIWESIRTPNSQSGSSLGSVEVHSFTLSHTPESMKCDFQASFLAHTFASLCFGREPKARVATHILGKLLMKATTLLHMTSLRALDKTLGEK
jgi:hypothetical protein